MIKELEEITSYMQLCSGDLLIIEEKEDGETSYQRIKGTNNMLDSADTFLDVISSRVAWGKKSTLKLATYLDPLRTQVLREVTVRAGVGSIT